MSNTYENVYNPDVLSCIANLSNDEVFTPPEIANQMLDMLPEELWSDSSATFLDPACKSGVFLREIAKRLIKGLENEFPNLQERIDHIFKKQLYGIAITELTSLLSRRSVYCSKYPNSKYSISQFDNASGNIRFKRIEHTWEVGKCRYCGASQKEYQRDEELETHAYEWIHTLRPEEIFNMKFDVIIGNPPYQLKTEGNSNGAQAKPIYNLFVEKAIKLNPRYLVMITPSRWMTGGWNLDNYRIKLAESKKIEELHDFPNSKDCFPGVIIKGGVSYFKYNSNYKGDCTYYIHENNQIVSKEKRPLFIDGMETVIRYNGAVSIVSKVLNYGEESFSEIVSPMKPFGLPTKYKGQEQRDKIHNIKIYANKNEYYDSLDNIQKNQSYIDKYKIVIPKAVGTGDPKTDLLKPIICEPGACCTETYVMVGPFNSKIICDNVLSYINTKFFHFFLTLHKDTQDCLKKTYFYIPMQDFSKSWTDKDLYEKYKLTKSEIELLESMIWPEKGGETNGK